MPASARFGRRRYEFAASWVSVAGSFALELPGGLRWVIEPPADPCGDGYVRTAVVGIWAGGLEARTVATFSDGPWNPARFFAELAADWRGWAGERR